MSSKFNRTYVSQVPELCYDGWGLTLPSTLYQELVVSKPFSQLVASVRSFVKSRDNEKLQQSHRRVKLEATRKKKNAEASPSNKEDAFDEDEEAEQEVEEEEEADDDDDDDGTLFDADDNAMYEDISTTTPDSQEYAIEDFEEMNNGSETGTAKKKIKLAEQKTPM